MPSTPRTYGRREPDRQGANRSACVVNGRLRQAGEGAAVCRIPCLILCLADIERVCQCRAPNAPYGLHGRMAARPLVGCPGVSAGWSLDSAPPRRVSPQPARRVTAPLATTQSDDGRTAVRPPLTDRPLPIHRGLPARLSVVVPRLGGRGNGPSARGHRGGPFSRLPRYSEAEGDGRRVSMAAAESQSVT